MLNTDPSIYPDLFSAASIANQTATTPTDQFDMMGLSPTSWLTQLLHSATANPALPLATANALVDDTTFDWGFSDFTQNIFDPIATRPPSPEASTSPSEGGEAADDELVVAVSAEEVDGRPHAKELPDGRPPESPWVSLEEEPM